MAVTTSGVPTPLLQGRKAATAKKAKVKAMPAMTQNRPAPKAKKR